MKKAWENAVLLAPNLWREKPDGIYLLGSMCDDCGEVFFPPKEIPVCSHCQGTNLHEIELGTEGVVHTYTVVHQPPAGGFYKGDVPFIYAIAEFPEGVHVQGM